MQSALDGHADRARFTRAQKSRQDSAVGGLIPPPTHIEITASNKRWKLARLATSSLAHCRALCNSRILGLFASSSGRLSESTASPWNSSNSLAIVGGGKSRPTIASEFDEFQ